MSERIPTDTFQRLQVAVLKIHNKSFPVYDGVNTVGRNKEAIVNVKHLNISQNHAIIVTINGNHFISDLQSSNGTFLENHKVEPFSLSELKNNTSIRLGDLRGTYISQGPFSNNDQSHFEMTQDVTQSFYGSNTQVMDNLKINYMDDEIDIHEAPTQEVSWTGFKIPKTIKPGCQTTTQITSSTKLPESQEDIHNCDTQVICHTVSKNDQSNIVQPSDEKGLGTIGRDGISKSDSNKNDAPQSLVNVEDIHEAPTQIFPLLSTNSNVNIQESELFGSYNDEELPVLENNDNYTENYQIPEVDRTLDIHEAVTQVIDISQKRKSPDPNSHLEDDEATDCEDNIDDVNKIKDSFEDLNNKHRQTNSQDEATDCEDNTQDKQVKPSSKGENMNSFLASDDDSNDSTEFFKLDKSITKESKENINQSDVAENELLLEVTNENKDGNVGKTHTNVKTKSSSDESIKLKKKKVCHLSSDSETDDEEIIVRRNKKSLMIISTQDLCEKESNENLLNLKDKSKKSNVLVDNYVINDTDSETEIECDLEESIPATQDQLIPDLNDTDCIPPTQEISKPLSIKLMIKNPKHFIENTNGSSEESFKLVLTESMTNSSQLTNNPSSQDPCCSKSLKNPSPIFGSSNLTRNEKVESIPSDDTDKTDIYEAPTQYVKKPEMDGADNNRLINDDESMIDLYLAPTQKITISEKGHGKSSLDHLNDTDVYDVPTQIIDVMEKHRIVSNRQIDTIDNDIYFAPTQKFCNELTENVYDAPTQKINIEHQLDKENQLDEINNDTYLAPTQKLPNNKRDTEHYSSREESMDELYLQPTQKLDDDIFNQPTQKVNYVTNLEVEGNRDENGFMKPNSAAGTSDNVSLQSKKKFAFKKNVPNLDGSLTNLLEHNTDSIPKQTSIKRENRSSIELELVQDVNPSSERGKRPSNPLSLILENDCKQDENEKTEQTTSIHVIHKSGNNIFTDDTNNQEETIDKSHSIGGKTENMEYTNKSKLDNEENSLDKNHIKKGTSTPTDVSRQDQIITNSGTSTRSLKISRPLAKSIANDKSAFSDSSKLGIQPVDSKKGENIKNKLNIEPVGLRNTRLRSSSSVIKTNDADLDINERKLQANPDLSDSSLNTTHSEVNQSVAFLESKITRTRKTRNSVKIEVKVPKSRKSMSISEIDQSSDPSDNNNIRSKMNKQTKKDFEINLPSASSGKSSITTNKRGRSKKRPESVDCDIQDNKSASETSDQELKILNNRSKRNTLKLEPVKEQEINSITNKKIKSNINNEPTSKFVNPGASKTRQIGKRKQVIDGKSDSSDTSVQSVDSSLTTPKKPKLLPSRQVGKRKQHSDEKSDNSDSSLQSVNSTPKKQKLQPSETLLNTRERELRKQRPKVVFTMLESPQMESMIKRLGGSVVDSVDMCTLLLTEHVKRSQKLLSAVGMGKPICSPKWITDSKKAHEFLDPWDYILTDPEAEKKWEFSLKESLNRSQTQKLLNSFNFQIMVTNAADVLKGAIESCGGKCISKIPSQPLENTFIISIPENQSKYKRIMKQHPNIRVIAPEAIFDGVLRQELRFSQHYLT